MAGLSLLGLGLFALIALLSPSTGVLGASLRDILQGMLGVLGYVLPFIIMLLGLAFILRKPELFANTRMYGFLLAVLVTAMLLSLNRIEWVHREDYLATLRNLLLLEETRHGGVLGMMLAVPLYRLTGPMGAYVVAGVLYVVALVLLLNTSVYEVLRQSGRAGRKAGVLLQGQHGKEQPKDGESTTTAPTEGSKERIPLDYREEHGKDKRKILEMMRRGEGKGTLEEDLPDTGAVPEEQRPTPSISDFDAAPNETQAPFPTPATEGAEEPKGKSVEKKRTPLSEETLEGVQLDLREQLKPQYEFPEIALMKQNIKGMLEREDRHEIIENAKKLEETLQSFGVEARVIHVSKGPSVTRYELQPKAGVKVSRIVSLSDDIALSLAASGVRIEAPIPGKAAVGIEIPNKETTPVYLREVIEDRKFQKSTNKIAIALGKDISGETVVGDLSRMPHVLIAGATGSGKSVCINSLIISILYKYDPDQVRLLMVDPKVVELNVYNGIPHLLIPVVTDPKKAASALNWAVNEMTRRYQTFADCGVRNIEGFNELTKRKNELQKLPYIVVIVDELADLMMVSANEVEDYIARLAQMARAAGMHLVIATQRPSVDVITGVIKANIPSRISFAVSSAIDSRTILDSGGAEKLLGKGDMLYYPVGEQKPKRVQGAFISEEEVEAIVSRIKMPLDKVAYDEEILQHIEQAREMEEDAEETDELFEEAVRVVTEAQQASTSLLQRRMRIGYNRAARIMDALEERGVISSRDGTKPRQVLRRDED